MNYTVATIGSHSALDICRGAKDEGFETLVVAQKGREKTYAKYYKTHANLGCIDEVVVLNKFSDILYKEIQEKLKKVIQFLFQTGLLRFIWILITPQLKKSLIFQFLGISFY